MHSLNYVTLIIFLNSMVVESILDMMKRPSGETLSVDSEAAASVAERLKALNVCKACQLRYARVMQTASYREALSEAKPEDPVCPCCVGTLQRLPQFVDHIVNTVQTAGYHFDDFNISVVLPASTFIRQWGFWHHLKATGGNDG